MTTIVLRSVKGSALTFAEADANFNNLNNDKLESSAYTPADVLAKLLTVDGTGSGLDADLLDGNEATAFATAGHNHDASYATLGHNHDASYAALSHNHDASYSALGHNHDSTYAPLSSPTFTGTVTIPTASTTRYGTTEYDAGNSGTTKTIDFANGQNQKLTLTGNVTITLSNPVAGMTAKLKILSGAGSFTAAFATTVKWANGTVYVATTTASATDIVTLYYDGTAWWGMYGKAFA